MVKTDLLFTASLTSIFIITVLSFFLLRVKTEHPISNRLFAAFLVLSGIDISLNPGYVLEISLTARIFLTSLFFLQLPVFYLYVLSVCYYDFKLKPRHLIHILPFLTANVIFLPRFYLVDMPSKIIFLQNIKSMPEVRINHILMQLQILCYLVAVFVILRKAKKIYLENFAGTSFKSLRWLYEFTIALSVFYFIALLKNVFKFTDYPGISEMLKIGLLLFELLIVGWYLFKALNNPGLFRHLDSKLKLVKDIALEEQNSREQPAGAAEDHAEVARLKQYMVEKKPFLNPSLTIQDLSDGMEVPTRELSLLINHKLAQHFFDFINSYRIESAMEILDDAAKSKITILEILYSVGFNSKSSFNTAFKKHTGITPTEYRKKPESQPGEKSHTSFVS